MADALLAGARHPVSARTRLEHALGSRARWVGNLARTLVKRFAGDWRDTQRDNLAREIEGLPAFQRACLSARPPRVRHIPVTPSRMASLPVALMDCVVPDLPTPRDVARWLDLSLDELLWLTGPLEYPLRNDAPVTHYQTRWVHKRSGGMRLIEIPKVQLRAHQRRLLHRLLDYVPVHEAAHGFRPRHSCVTNARPHMGQAVVVRMDLEDFFGSIGGGKVYKTFTALGYPAAAATALTRLTTCATPADALAPTLTTLDWHARKRLQAPHLPQGAPTSPALANLCAFNFDVRVQALAEKFSARYTRYADDLTFSGNAEFRHRAHALQARVAAIATEEGFRINHRKTKVMPSATRQRVTGIVVNRTTNIARVDFDRLKATLHNCAKHGPATQCMTDVYTFRNHLAGHIAHLSAIHPVRGARLRQMFSRISWSRGMVDH